MTCTCNFLILLKDGSCRSLGRRNRRKNRTQNRPRRAQNPASQSPVPLQRLRPVDAKGRGHVPPQQSQSRLVVRPEGRRHGRLRPGQLRRRDRAENHANPGAQAREGQGRAACEENEDGEAKSASESAKAGEGAQEERG